MKNWWFWFLIFCVVIFFWNHKKRRIADVVSVESETLQSEPLESAHGPIPKQADHAPKSNFQQSQAMPSATRSATPISQAKEEVNPYHVDRFTLRKLDLPQPKSVGDLIGKLTDFKEPMLPVVLPVQEGDGDGDVLTGPMRGYYEITGGGLKRIQVARDTGGISVSLEEANGEYHEWQTEEHKLKLKNFNNDPYSLVIILPDNRMIYLKFHARIRYPGVDYRVRGMTGWILSNSGETSRASRTAVVGDLGGELAVFGQAQSDGTQWPSIDDINRILPENLPQ